MSSFLDATGATQQLPMAVTMYAEASNMGLSLPEYLNCKYKTNKAKYGSVFDQVCESEGIFLQSNADVGIRASTLDSMLNGDRTAGITVKDGVPASRILYPAVFLQALEDRLVPDMLTTPAAFDSMIAISESINGDRYEQPVINYTAPSAARSLGITQLAKPTAMMTITTSDKAYTIPTFALGLEISDQAVRSQSLNLVTLSLARQIVVERNERANNYILALLNGDIDNGEVSLAAAGRVATTTSFDSASSGGVMTQKAWIKYLCNRSTLRTISHIIGNLDGLFAIENRTGRPTVVTDNNTSARLNTEMELMNPQFPSRVKAFHSLDLNWPAGMLMGLDSRYAIRRVRNLQADYTAIESFVLERKTAMRFDFGETVSRFYTDAFDCLQIA